MSSRGSHTAQRFRFLRLGGKDIKTRSGRKPADFGMIDPLSFHLICSFSDDGLMRLFKDGLKPIKQEQINILSSRDIGNFSMSRKTIVTFVT